MAENKIRFVQGELTRNRIVSILQKKVYIDSACTTYVCKYT
jgi:hypothetical protein